MPWIPSSTLPLVPYARIMQEELPPVVWVVEGLIAQGDRVVLYGEFGSMKSWLLLDMGIHIAAGRPWLDQFQIPQAKRVLYIDEEMNVRTMRRRIRRLGTETPMQDQNIPFMVMSQVGVTFDDGGANRLLDALQQSHFDPEIVIVETLRRVMVGSENEAERVSAFWRYLEPLRSSGKTVIISHHMRKPSQQGRDDNRNRASGSTDILAGPDTGFAIERQGDSILIECVKCREGEEMARFDAVLRGGPGQDSPLRMYFEGFRATSDQQPRTQVQRAIELIVAYLTAMPSQSATTGQIQEHLRGRGIPSRTVSRALRDLRRDAQSRVRIVRRGVWSLRLEAPHAA